jgi:cell wall-associated NlpC family hydrolase
VELKESDLQPGDLIFYANSSGTVYHVAIYIGDGKVVHAANAKKGITISEYTYMKPYKARRIIT